MRSTTEVRMSNVKKIIAIFFVVLNSNFFIFLFAINIAVKNTTRETHDVGPTRKSIKEGIPYGTKNSYECCDIRKNNFVRIFVR